MAWKCGAIAGPLGPGLVRPATEEFTKEAVTALRAGKVIAVPTDTLYGFACDACDDAMAIVKKSSPSPPTTDHTVANNESPKHNRIKACPSCGHQIEWQEKDGIHNLPGLPAGVKFDPSDQELLEHLEAKVRSDTRKLHPLIDEFIPTLEGENGICYAHPEKLPGVSKDGFIRHFFHRPSKAYTTGTRKRRKVHADIDGNETRWHKTGKTRAVFIDQGKVIKGYKKILVLYTNYGKQRKPEKTNWIMHQYHLGNNDDEKDGELVVSKIFFQTQPRQCSSSTISATNSRHSAANLPKDNLAVNTNSHGHGGGSSLKNNSTMFVDYYSQSLISFKQTTS